MADTHEEGGVYRQLVATEDLLLKSEERVVTLKDRLLDARGLIAWAWGYLEAECNQDDPLAEALRKYLEVKD